MGRAESSGDLLPSSEAFLGAAVSLLAVILGVLGTLLVQRLRHRHQLQLHEVEWDKRRKHQAVKQEYGWLRKLLSECGQVVEEFYNAMEERDWNLAVRAHERVDRLLTMAGLLRRYPSLYRRVVDFVGLAGAVFGLMTSGVSLTGAGNKIDETKPLEFSPTAFDFLEKRLSQLETAHGRLRKTIDGLLETGMDEP